MQFKEVLGNKDLALRLIRMADSSRTGHSLMFVERDGCGALPLAMAFIQYLMCRGRHEGEDSCGVCPSCRKISGMMHPDLHFAFPVNSAAGSGASKKPLSGSFMQSWRDLYKSDPYFTEADLYSGLGIDGKAGVISVAEAKEILDSLSLKSYEGYGKYMVVWLPERMNAEAANRLLKIVEEPMPDTYFIFITHAPEKVISTIRSRSQMIRLYPVPVEESVPYIALHAGVTDDEAKVYARISGGSPGLALSMATEGSAASQYLPAVTSMLDAVDRKDMVSLLEGNEALAALGREKQKDFCAYLEEFLRKVMMHREGLASIADALPSEREAVARFCPVFHDSFYRKAFNAIEEARQSIEANVNAKMIFCNLSNMLFAINNF